MCSIRVCVACAAYLYQYEMVKESPSFAIHLWAYAMTNMNSRCNKAITSVVSAQVWACHIRTDKDNNQGAGMDFDLS